MSELSRCGRVTQSMLCPCHLACSQSGKAKIRVRSSNSIFHSAPHLLDIITDSTCVSEQLHLLSVLAALSVERSSLRCERHLIINGLSVFSFFRMGLNTGLRK